MKYPRVIQEIHQIEPTSKCNLRCQYCPHPKMQRPKEDMEWSTFMEAMKWVKKFYDLGLQKELSFTGIGEATLHPEFCAMLIEARSQCPTMPIVFSTNGLPSFHEGIAECCKEHNVQVMISLHRPEVAGLAIQMAKKYGILKFINNSFATEAFDWAGQVPTWFNSTERVVCEYLRSGWGVVLQDGKITTCCLDAENKGVVGTVWDEPGSLKMEPYELCKSCHMEQP